MENLRRPAMGKGHELALEKLRPNNPMSEYDAVPKKASCNKHFLEVINLYSFLESCKLQQLLDIIKLKQTIRDLFQSQTSG